MSFHHIDDAVEHLSRNDQCGVIWNAGHFTAAAKHNHFYKLKSVNNRDVFECFDNRPRRNDVILKLLQ